jgi:hypothetical protein
LIVFLGPYAGKTIHHHHPHYDLLSDHNKDRVVSENCPICNFEFCAFTKGKQPVFSQPEGLLSEYLFQLLLKRISGTYTYSFFLRAPPV